MEIWVRTPAALLALVESLRGVHELALDTESDSLHHHTEKVCLVQWAAPSGHACLIDPLALPDLSPLAEVMADPEVCKVFHGADYDVTTLKRDFGFRFASLFDTMIAARFLGRQEFGLMALARTELGVTLSKDSQKDDWSRRPLTPRQEQYALADVTHLLALRVLLRDELVAKGRLAWVEEECEAVAALEPSQRRRDPDAFARVKGVNRLNRRQQAVVRELYAWRDGMAESTDIPAFKLLSSEALLELGVKQPKSVAEVQRVRGVSPRVRAHAEALRETIARALALPDEALPRPARTARPEVSAQTRRRVGALRAWRVAEAARLALDVSVVLPQRLLDKVAEAAPRQIEALREVDGLRRWRTLAFGDAMLHALRAV